LPCGRECFATKAATKAATKKKGMHQALKFPLPIKEECVE